MVASRRALNIYRMVAHGGPTGEGFLALGNALLRHSDLDPRIRELVILRVGALCGCAYEIFQHRRIATEAGVPGKKIEAVLDASKTDGEVFTRFESDVLFYTDAVVHQVKAPEALFNALASVLPPKQIVELTTTIGFYMLVCRLLENLEVDLEEDVNVQVPSQSPNVAAR